MEAIVRVETHGAVNLQAGALHFNQLTFGPEGPRGGLR